MNKYYYFVSQLPFLQFDKSVPVSVDAFLTEAEKWLTDTDYRLLDRTNINRFEHIERQEPEALKEFKEFEYVLRKQISEYRRSQKQKKENKLSGKISRIVSEANSLEAERAILKLRWGFLEEKELSYHFDLNFLIIYFLKMQLIARVASFDKEKGMRIFNELSRNIM